MHKIVSFTHKRQNFNSKKRLRNIFCISILTSDKGFYIQTTTQYKLNHIVQITFLFIFLKTENLEFRNLENT